MNNKKGANTPSFPIRICYYVTASALGLPLFKFFGFNISAATKLILLDRVYFTASL